MTRIFPAYVDRRLSLLPKFRPERYNSISPVTPAPGLLGSPDVPTKMQQKYLPGTLAAARLSVRCPGSNVTNIFSRLRCPPVFLSVRIPHPTRYDAKISSGYANRGLALGPKPPLKCNKNISHSPRSPSPNATIVFSRLRQPPTFSRFDASAQMRQKYFPLTLPPDLLSARSLGPTATKISDRVPQKNAEMRKYFPLTPTADFLSRTGSRPKNNFSLLRPNYLSLKPGLPVSIINQFAFVQLPSQPKANAHFQAAHAESLPKGEIGHDTPPHRQTQPDFSPTLLAEPTPIKHPFDKNPAWALACKMLVIQPPLQKLIQNTDIICV